MNRYFSVTYDMSKLSDDEQKAVIAEASSAFRSQKAVCAGWESGDNNGWLDIKEHFPDRNVILAHHADGTIRVADLFEARYKYRITHWRPLPQPPKELKDE